MIETVRVSKTAKDQLMTLKRRTGLTQWNELCRWALCRSLAEPSPPTRMEIPLEGGVEMDWRTFAGSESEIYLALVQGRCDADGLRPDESTVAEQLRLHLHRGIGYLAGDKALQGIDDLVAIAAKSSSSR